MDADCPHILVVDDDDRLRELLRKYLSENDFLVSTASDAADARAKLAGLAFDLIVLDIMMPGEDGLSFTSSLRRENNVPVLMLTAMGEPEDRIAGLEKGADDYLTKPFDPRELLLRIQNILRRVPTPPQPAAPAEIRMGAFVYEPEGERLSCDGAPIRLTSIETALLKALAERPGMTLTREELIELTGASGGGRAIDVQVTRLRRKIEPDPRVPVYLQTVRGKGYVLRPD